MSSTMSFEVVYTLYHWMAGDISPQVLAAKHRRASTSESINSPTVSSDSEAVELQAIVEGQRETGVPRHRRTSSDTSGKSVRFV